MSHDPHHEMMVQHHGPVDSAPVTGHADTSFEATDASVGIIVGSLIVIVLTLVISAAIVVPIFRLLRAANPPGELPSPIAPARVVPQKPVLQVHPWEEFPNLVNGQIQALNSYGKTVAGDARIPIQQAIDNVAGQLPVRANAPQGYMVPGGQGREFSHSLAEMPPAYQGQIPPTGPTIQGEIQKNAKK